MAHVKPSAMREMTPDEIRTRLGELRDELFQFRFRNAMKQLDNPLKIRGARREMARLLTVLAAKERGPGAAEAPDARTLPGRRRKETVKR